MTEKPAENGPVDPTEAEPPHTAAHAPRDDDTVPLLDATKQLPPDDGTSGTPADEPRPETPPPPGGFPPPPPPGGFPPPPPAGGFPPPPGGYPPPPPGGYPPPPPGGYPPPPPAGGAFATRYGLVRPLEGRWCAGVAAAIGRATNTDPILWRVLFGVLTLFGGFGLLAYVLGWLLIPAEGDTASPAEALIGRGQSSTSGPLAVGLAVVAVIMLAVAFPGDVRGWLLGAALIAGVILLVSRNGVALGRRGGPPAGTPPRPEWLTSLGWPTQPGSPTPPGNPTSSTSPTPPIPPTGAPFAPHGPYAGSSPYAQSRGYSPPLPPQYPGLSQTPPKPPKPPRERSRLGRVVLSLVCLALGALAALDLAGRSVPAAAYIAAALGVIGLGLVVGAWLGRARWLIFPGLVLTVALLIASSVAHTRPWRHGPWGVGVSSTHGNVTWAPPNAAALESRYDLGLGNGTLDLTKVEFPANPVSVDVNVDAGNLVVILPPNVDVEVDAGVDSGSADVLGQHWDGLGTDSRHISDNGADGPGGGQLLLHATVSLGKLEVHR